MITLATFAAGCFWHVQAAFDAVREIQKTTVGFMGGKVKNPSYELVCTHLTEHAEVCQIEYDPKKISYEELLKVFWKIHDPTQKNRQGLDIGNQYRSAIFYHTEEQRKIAEESKKKEQKKYQEHIVTEIVPATEFYSAEEYHQKYLEKRGRKVC